MESASKGRWEPLARLEEVQSELDRLWEKLSLGRPMGRSIKWPSLDSRWMPSVDVFE